MKHALMRTIKTDDVSKSYLRQSMIICSFLYLVLIAGVAPVRGEIETLSLQTLATVNGTAISRGELDREIIRLQLKSGNRGGEEPGKELRLQALDGLIDRELLWQESLRKGIAVPNDEVVRQLEKLRKSAPSPLELGQALEELNLSPETMRREIERQIAVMALLERQIENGSEPSEVVLRDYYDRHPRVFRVPEKIRISHILVRIDPRWRLDKKDEARQQINVLRDRFRNGEEFAVLARENSDCPSADKGGDLGWFGRGDLAGAVEKTAFSLSDGATSSVIEDRYGFHLIRVTDRKAARTVPYSEARPKIVRFLRSERMREEGLALARTLRRGATIEITPHEVP